MPIDPQSGLDPETGMMGLKETHQPTGAIGAVMSYLNADKSRQISQALQQHRAASAQMAQQQADEYAARQVRDEQQRKAFAALDPNAGPDEVISMGLRNGMDVERALPWMRAKTAATGKLDVARVKAGADLYTKMTTVGGQPPNQAMGFLAGVYTPEELDAIKQLIGGHGDLSLPNPAAKQMKDTAGANLDIVKGQDLEATRQPRIDALKAKVTTDRILAQAAKDRASRPGGTHQRSTTLAMEGQIARLGKYISDAMNTTDPYTFKKGPADMTEVNKWKAQQARLEAELAAADEGDDDEELPPAKKAASAVAKPGAPKGSPSPFGDTFSSFLKPTTKPAGGDVTTSPGGTSSPPPDDRLGLLK